MTVTAAQAANVLNYLAAAQAVTLMDNADAVWADFLNNDCPAAKPTDLLPAARRALHDWSRTGRTWRIDAGRFSAAVKAVRQDRLNTDQKTHGHVNAPRDLPPATGNRWKATVEEAIRDGQARGAAEAHAWRTIGITPAQVAPHPPHPPNQAATQATRAALAAIMAAGRAAPRQKVPKS